MQENREKIMKRTWMFLTICLLAFSGCERSSGAEPNGSLFVSGRIDGDTVDVSFQRSGQIIEINVREGDTVTAGQQLAMISSPQDLARRDAQMARIVSDQRRKDQLQHQLATYAERVRQAQIYEEQAQADAPSQVKQAEANLAVSQADLVKWEAEIRQTQADAVRYAPLVKSGALAVQIEEQNDTRQKIALASADVSRKQVAVAEAEILRAKAQLQNIPLKEADRVTLERQVDELKSSIASAQADVEADQAELRRIEADLADLKVTAPIAGTILTRTAEPGRVVAPGQTILTMVDLSKLYLRGFVPEENVGRIKVGQPAQIYLDSNPKEAIAATVIRIDPEAMFTPENTYFKDDRVKQVMGVKLGLMGANGFAKPGMPADGNISIGKN
jgi:HlyD family secretion protein